MKTKVEFTAAETRELGELLAAHASGRTFEKLSGDWVRMVEQIEAGYDDSIYEYTNDLAARDILRRVLAAASASLAEKLRGAIADTDQRFMAATTEAKKPLGKISDKEKDAFWWFRAPKKLSAELKADLKSEGMID